MYWAARAESRFGTDTARARELYSELITPPAGD